MHRSEEKRHGRLRWMKRLTAEGAESAESGGERKREGLRYAMREAVPGCGLGSRRRDRERGPPRRREGHEGRAGEEDERGSATRCGRLCGALAGRRVRGSATRCGRLCRARGRHSVGERVRGYAMREVVRGAARPGGCSPRRQRLSRLAMKPPSTNHRVHHRKRLNLQESRRDPLPNPRHARGFPRLATKC